MVDRESRGPSADLATVGPVLLREPLGEAVLAAIAAANPQVQIVDRGAYLRVLAKSRCAVTRAAIEEQFGAPITLPGDLEAVMPSWKGRLRITSDAVWWLAGAEEQVSDPGVGTLGAEGDGRR